MNYNVTLNSKTKNNNKKKTFINNDLIKIKWRRNLSVTCFGMIKFSGFHVW